MFCSVCGKWIHENAPFCPYCGAVRINDGKKKKKRKNKQQPVMYMPMGYQNMPTYPAEQQQKEESNGLALAGFICSFFIPILGWIFGGVGLSRANKRNGKGKGFAIASLIISTLVALGYYSTTGQM